MKSITIAFTRVLFFIAISLGCAAHLRGQNVQVQQGPDCQISFYFNTSSGGTTIPLANYGPGSTNGGNLCTFWTLAYASEGFTAYTITVQNAPAATYTTPGTWVTYAGTVSTGSNPVVCSVSCNPSQGQVTLSNGTVGIPWVRVNVSGVTGTGVIFGILQGWNFGNAAGGGGGGGGGSGCAGTVATPCVTGAESSAGAAVTDFRCDQTGAITISGSGLTQIVGLSSGKAIKLCHVSLSNTASSTVQIEYGTGTNCGTGTTAVSGTYQGVLTLALDFDPRDTPVIPSGKAVCLNFGSSVTSGGLVQYAIF